MAHRLSTIRDAHLVLVLAHGRIVERGGHHELVARQGGEYAALWRKQTRGGKTLFGLGSGTGEGAVAQAVESLRLCPLLTMPECARRADRLLVNITGGTVTIGSGGLIVAANNPTITGAVNFGSEALIGT